MLTIMEVVFGNIFSNHTGVKTKMSLGFSFQLHQLMSYHMNGSPLNRSPVDGSPMNGTPVNDSPVNGSFVNGSPMNGSV